METTFIHCPDGHRLQVDVASQDVVRNAVRFHTASAETAEPQGHWCETCDRGFIRSATETVWRPDYLDGLDGR